MVFFFFLFQGIFLTQGSNPCLLHWQEDSLPTEAPENPTYNSSHVFNNSRGSFPGDLLFQGLFLTQGSNPHLLHWQEDSLPTEAPENPTCNSSHVFNHSFIQEYLLRTFKLPGTECACYWGYNKVKEDRVPALRKCESKQENQRRKEAINFPLSGEYFSSASEHLGKAWQEH